ncbi:MAG: sulfotransferase [Proteobacteria bacterium]|nr:sulfotransferase [Pseudomonadota bacterium]HQR04398.1 sulfotransferase [Rhodocyclaceae bacterium]
MAFDLKAMLDEASKRADGLTDFGPEDFRPGLEAVISAMNGEGGLSELGEQILGGRIIEMLKNRLVIEDYFYRYPEIADEQIEGPIVIVGLPRTGTTLLQRILSVDPRFYPILWWETRYPAPVNDPATDKGPDPRIDLAKAEVKALIEANPVLMSIHPWDATGADEEGMLLEHSFRSFFDAYVDIPGYTRWMWDNDQTPAYEYLKRVLKFVQWQKRQRGIQAGPWVLKAPHHLRQIDVLFKVFPDTRVIQTHRDPLQTIPSIASFHFNLWQVYMKNPDPTRVGRQWSDIWARGMQETMQYRDASAADRFLDIWFADTLTKPLEVVKTIYDFLGYSFPEDTKEKMQVFLEANSRDKRPVHDYTMEYFGLSEAQIRQDFAGYRARYIEPHDK